MTASHFAPTIRQRLLEAARAVFLFAGLAAPARSADWNGYEMLSF